MATVSELDGDMEENKVATDSSAPNSPELTRLSGEQAEERTAREGRAKEWLAVNSVNGATEDGTWVQCATTEVVRIMAAYAESECSRLASRVEELEKLIAKHSGCSHGNDSALGGIDK